MKVAILGATGITGSQLVAQALQRGLKVTGLARNPANLQSFASNPNFKTGVCNLNDINDLGKNLAGHDAVLSTLGLPGIHFSKTSFYSDSIKSVVEGMRKAQVKRLICVTALYTKPDPNYPLFFKLIIKPIMGRQFSNMYEMEEYLFKQAHDINYTIVRPPRLTEDKLSGYYFCT